MPRLPFVDCTLDFAPSRAEPRVLWLIEVNPPPPTSGTPFFSLASEEDRAVLRDGPYEFRHLPAANAPLDGSALPAPVAKMADAAWLAAQPAQTPSPAARSKCVMQ
mmetsp:Transcript_20105/g.51001  ORF Transcript_20105/g.51001 Transcript_20105/m.51001 type:complete len:106 (+) Transcript_20105:1262-1579(+)